MPDPQQISIRRLFVTFVLALSGGALGALIGHLMGDTLATSPVWLGPAVLFLVIAALLLAFLLIPTLVRARRKQR